MKTIDHLLYSEPVAVCEIHAGTFFYVDEQGEECRAEFYVRTCDDTDQAKQVDDLNEQYTDEFSDLLIRGCTKIRYEEVSPSPFF